MELQSNVLNQSLAEADAIISRSYLIDVAHKDIVPSGLSLADSSNMRLFRLKMLVFNPEENINDKLTTVYSALLDAVDEINVGLIIRSFKSGDVEFMFAISAGDETGNAAKLLSSGLIGNFPGSELQNLSRSEINECVNSIFGNGCKEVASLSVLPAMRDQNSENFIQGIEKFVDAMRGKEFTACFISEGIKRAIAEIKKNGFEVMYSALVPFSKISLAYGVNESQSVADSITHSTNQSLARGVSRAVTDGTSISVTESHGHSSSYRTDGTGDGLTWGENESVSVTRGQTHSVSNSRSETTTTGSSESRGETHTGTRGSSLTKTIENQNKTVINMMTQIEKIISRIDDAETYGLWNCACYFIADDLQTLTLTTNTYKALVTGQGTGEEDAYINIWSTISEMPNQRTKLQELLYYILNLKHPVFSFSKREKDFKDTGFLISGKDLPVILGLPRRTIPGLIVYSIAEFGRNVFTKNLIIQKHRKRLSAKIAKDEHGWSALDFLTEKYPYKSRTEWNNWFTDGKITLHSTSEKRICDAKDILSHGEQLQFSDTWNFKIGEVFHMGNVENTEVVLDMDSFTSHCFIAGSTGSGKSNTTYHILEQFIEHNVPFLVIEPAKGEYKKDFGKLPGIKIFTTNQQYNQLLRINPFRFQNNIHVLEHLDRLIEIFNVCWEMTPAVQAFLKNAIEVAYVKKGWDLANSINLTIEKKYPTLNDLLTIIPELVSQAQYSANTKNDIEGALLTRIKTLTNGIFGQIFCSDLDISDETLFNQNVVIDLSRIGSLESKSLIMGIIVTKLSEFRSAMAQETNQGIKHITILEEAHNLLKNTSGNASQLTSKSVEMICNGIAEMRTYGEGFIIVDQSPTAVDIAAIKNTNTKIIMRLPDKTDCEISGNAFGLNEYQMSEIPKLPQGVAIVMQSNWIKPVLTKISRAAEKYSLPKIQQTSMQDIMVFRGSIVNELIRQRDAEMVNLDIIAIQDALKQLTVPDSLKSEFEDIIYPQLVRISSLKSMKELGDFVLSLLNCKGVFEYQNRFVALIIKAKTSDEICKFGYQWRTKVAENLKFYFSPYSPNVGGRIFDWIAFALCGQQGEDNLTQAYKKFIRTINKGAK